MLYTHVDVLLSARGFQKLFTWGKKPQKVYGVISYVKRKEKENIHDDLRLQSNCGLFYTIQRISLS